MRACWQARVQAGVLWDGKGSGLPSRPSSLPFILTGRRGHTYHPKAPQGQPRELLPWGCGPHGS